jgi:hypothetical protein
MNKKIWYILKIEKYSVTKRSEASTYAITCMNLKIIVLNERSQTQKATHCMILLMQYIYSRIIHRDRKHISGYQRLEGREKGKVA